MFLREIIFSSKALYKIARHLIFWFIYAIFFYLQSLTPEVVTVLYHSNAFYFAWVSVYCYMPACIVSVYTFLYFILPFFLQKKKFTQFLIVALLLYALLNVEDYFISVLFFKKTCGCDITTLKPITFFSFGNNNAFLAIAIGTFAAGIKFVKEWYLQRKQVLEMENEKATAELQALKTAIQPDFLFQSLQSLKKNIEVGELKSPEMILQFSDVLSYLLYDCNADFVFLHQEISAVAEYLLLEKNKTKFQFIIDVNIKEDFRNLLIVPSTLLYFLQHCFINLNDYAERRLRIKVNCSLRTTELFFLFSIYDVHEMILPIHLYEEVITTFENKLEKFYANNHLLNMHFQKHLIEITLNLTLSETIALHKAEQFKKNV